MVRGRLCWCLFCSMHDEQGGTTTSTCCSVLCCELWCCVARKAWLVASCRSPAWLVAQPISACAVHLCEKAVCLQLLHAVCQVLDTLGEAVCCCTLAAAPSRISIDTTHAIRATASNRHRVGPSSGRSARVGPRWLCVSLVRCPQKHNVTRQNAALRPRGEIVPPTPGA